MSLPSGYKELKYIVTQQESFLRLYTDFGGAGAVRIRIDCMTTANSCFYGGTPIEETAQGYYAGAYNNSASQIEWFSDDDAGVVSGWSHNTRHTFEWIPGNGIYIDDVRRASSSDITNYGNLYVLYGKPYNSKTYFYGQVYLITIAGHIFTPALRVSDNVAGFYCDNGVFYPSGGDSPFIAGEEVQTSSIFRGTQLIGSIFKGINPIEHVYFRGYDLLGGSQPIPTIEYDYVDQNEYDEVDILYTTDTHLAWLGSGSSPYSENPTFYLSDIAYYKDKLWNAGIPAFCVDCGDFIHGNGNTDTLRNAIINTFNNLGSVGYNKYLAVTFGNHEWYAAMGDAEACMSYLRRVVNMTACNLLSGGNTCFKPYRAIKIGSKKIAIIAVGYPSPNGRGTSGQVHTFGNYSFYDAEQSTASQPSSALYVQVQKYIDMFKARNFDYIVAITHMDKYADEDFSADNRFNSRADFLIKNTSGLDLVIPGHYNYAINSTYSYQGLDGKTGIVVQEAGASLHNIGRIRFRFNEAQPIQSYLLDDRGDLEVTR